MITELCRLIYTYSEYFHAHWVNCTKMCKKIHKTIIFSTYLPNLGALWHDFGCVCTMGCTGRAGCAIRQHFLSALQKSQVFSQLLLKNVIYCTFFHSRGPTVQVSSQKDQFWWIPCWLNPPAPNTARSSYQNGSLFFLVFLVMFVHTL